MASATSKKEVGPPATIDGVLRAAGRGDLETLRDLLTQNPSLVDAHDDTGRTPLDVATARGQGAAARLLAVDFNARWIPLVSFGSASEGSRKRAARQRQVMRLVLAKKEGSPAGPSSAHTAAGGEDADPTLEVAQRKRAVKRAPRVGTRAHALWLRNTGLAKAASEAADERKTAQRAAEKGVLPPRPTNWSIALRAPEVKGGQFSTGNDGVRRRRRVRSSVKEIAAGAGARSSPGVSMGSPVNRAARGAGKRAARREQLARAPRRIAIDLRVSAGGTGSELIDEIDAITQGVTASLGVDGDAAAASPSLGVSRDAGLPGAEGVENDSEASNDESDDESDDGAAGVSLVAEAIGAGWDVLEDAAEPPMDAASDTSALSDQDNDWEMV